MARNRVTGMVTLRVDWEPTPNFGIVLEPYVKVCPEADANSLITTLSANMGTMINRISVTDWINPATKMVDC